MANQLKGQLRIAPLSSRQAVEPTRDIPSTTVSVSGVIASGADAAGAADNADAAVFDRASQVFSRMSQKIGEIADRARAKEGEAEGALAGLDREFRPRGDPSIYSEAFDRSAIATYKAKMSADLVAQMDEVFDKQQDSPKGVAKALSGIKAGWQSQISPELAPHVVPEFEALFARHSTGLIRQATRNHQERVRADQLAAVQTELATRMRTVEQQAYRLGLDSTADDVLAGEVVSLRSSLAAHGPDGRPLVAPATQAKLLRDAEEQIARSRIIGAFNRLESRADKERFVADVQQRYLSGNDKLLNTFDVQSYETLVGHLASDARRLGIGEEMAVRQLDHDVKTIEKAASEGFAISETQMAEVKGRLAVNGTPEQIDTFGKALRTISTVKQLQVMTPAEQEQAIANVRQRLQASGVDPKSNDLDGLILAEKHLEKLKSDVEQDPLGRASRDRLADVPALDMASGETFAATAGRRASVAKGIAEHYGRDVKFFRPEERQQLASAARQGDKTLLSIAGGIVAGFGADAPQALAEIAPDAPELAMVAGLMHGADGSVPAAAQDAAIGIATRRAKDFKAMAPSEKLARETAAGITGNALGSLPASQDAAIAVANAIYERRARLNSVAEFDPALWSQGYREALGERTIGGKVYGGVAAPDGPYLFDKGRLAIVPMNVRQDGFYDLIQTLRLDDLTAANGAPLHGDGSPATLASVRRARFVSSGDGRYYLSLGTDDDPRYLMASDGRPYELDLKALEPQLKKRRPDLYLGGR